MKTKNLLLPKQVLLILIVLSLSLAFSGAYLKISHLPYASPLLIIALGIQVIVSITTLIDIVKSQLSSKIKWFVIALFFGSLGCLFYLTNRSLLLEEPQNINPRLENINKKERATRDFFIMSLVFFQIARIALKIFHIDIGSIPLILSLAAVILLVISSIYFYFLKEKIRKE